MKVSRHVTEPQPPVRTLTITLSEDEVHDLRKVLGPINSGKKFGDGEIYDLFTELKFR